MTGMMLDQYSFASILDGKKEIAMPKIINKESKIPAMTKGDLFGEPNKFPKRPVSKSISFDFKNKSADFGSLLYCNLFVIILFLTPVQYVSGVSQGRL